ncbi:MAG: efflux transporter outer membrane subunit [Ramlibacter sp.]
MHTASFRPARPGPRLGAAAGAAAAAFVLAGCSTPVLSPKVDVPDHFAAAAAASNAAEPEAAWWDSYGDPVLADLIRRAARENRDVRIAAERVRAARAGETISRSWLMPSVGVSAKGLDNSTGYDSRIRQQMPDQRGVAGGLDVSWELDLSGRLRAGASAAAADVVAAEDGARGVRLLAISDVATNYFTLAGALRQLETVRAISAAHEETLRQVTSRQRVGLATAFDVERAQTAAAQARAAIPPLETLVAVSRHRISVLVGGQASDAAAIVPWNGKVLVPQARPGQPATLLQRRPDVQALMAQVDAANARRREAAAEWFPRLFLNASFGRESLSANGASIGAARFTNAAALLAMPIFNAGRTGAINDVAAAGQSESVLRAEDGIVRALEDVENALVSLHQERTRAEALRIAATSADAALGRAQSLYDRGQIDLLPLLEAQRERLAVSMSANDSDTALLVDSVRLYKALGGGWEAFEPAAPAAKATTASNRP